jgi:DNA helicase-2/ATP-dependent DNA helicase PcrA
MTRAREKLWMTHTRIRRVWGQEQMNAPSRFLKEIPKQYTRYSTAVGLSQNSPRFSESFNHRNQSNYSQSSFGQQRSQNFADDYSQSTYDDDYSQVTPQVSKDSGYAKGQRVRHPTFGVGSIFQTEGSGETLKISVLFQDNTIKKFVAKYARLEKV